MKSGNVKWTTNLIQPIIIYKVLFPYVYEVYVYVNAVSYTHLDVYKRQILHCAIYYRDQIFGCTILIITTRSLRHS